MTIDYKVALGMKDGTQTENQEKGGGYQKWEIVEIKDIDQERGNTGSGLPQANWEGCKRHDKGGLGRDYYLVESPVESPSKSNEIMMLQTGLSPLLQKVNMKSKHDEGSESKEKEMESTRTKRQRIERVERGTRAKQKSPRGGGEEKRVFEEE